ncbi:hypothetical protein BTUL_0192g00140 [Botrytis tulipae]|uniref:Uncharacterized protein n=1 Tax=Botrytis tulipae TaxID=87230 RepID=A0A4Z1EBJ1_9HELO|nr:hypothetical protein BTUL_0192g00140 [Botrytis tulipae]
MSTATFELAERSSQEYTIALADGIAGIVEFAEPVQIGGSVQDERRHASPATEFPTLNVFTLILYLKTMASRQVPSETVGAYHLKLLVNFVHGQDLRDVYISRLA